MVVFEWAELKDKEHLSTGLERILLPALVYPVSSNMTPNIFPDFSPWAVLEIEEVLREVSSVLSAF